METVHLNAALHPLLQSTYGGCNTPYGAEHLVCNQVLYSIRHERALLNVVSSPLHERLPEGIGESLSYLHA